MLDILRCFFKYDLEDYEEIFCIYVIWVGFYDVYGMLYNFVINSKLYFVVYFLELVD